MTEVQIKHMVNRFLMWSFPESIRPDGGFSFTRTKPHPDSDMVYPMPVGTNLLDATQAEAMVRHMIEGLPADNRKGSMTDSEAILMMQRCKHELITLRRQIELMGPKAEAYDNLAAVLRLLPRPSIGMGEDLVWVLDKRISELSPKPE